MPSPPIPPCAPPQRPLDALATANCEKCGLFTAVISAPEDELEREQLPQAIHRQIEALFGSLPAPRWQQTIRERRATFSCTPDLARPAMASGLPGLLLAGDYVASPYPATLESAIQSGMACARELNP